MPVLNRQAAHEYQRLWWSTHNRKSILWWTSPRYVYFYVL